MKKTVTKSPAKALCMDDLRRRWRDILVFVWPILLVVLENIDKQDLKTTLIMFWTLLLSALIDLLKRFLTDYTR